MYMYMYIIYIIIYYLFFTEVSQLLRLRNNYFITCIIVNFWNVNK
jgi:hypothetical protein